MYSKSHGFQRYTEEKKKRRKKKMGRINYYVEFSKPAST